LDQQLLIILKSLSLFFTKIPDEEVNCSGPSPSVSVPCLNLPLSLYIGKPELLILGEMVNYQNVNTPKSQVAKKSNHIFWLLYVLVDFSISFLKIARIGIVMIPE
jgi:hypothetical protein